MAITTLAGGTNASVRNETNINQAGSVPLVRYHHAQQIYWKNGDFAPFCQLCDALGKERGHDYRTIWKEDEAIPQADTLAGSAATDSTTVTVSNVAQWMPNDTLYVHGAGGAYAIVTAVNQTTGVLTISWLPGHAPAAAIAAGTAILRLGTAYEQWSRHYPGPTTRAYECYNVFQDFRKGIAIADQVASDPMRVTPHDWEYQHKKLFSAFRRELEKTFWFGQRSFTAAGYAGNTQPLGTMQGLYHYGATNITSAAAGFTRTVWDNWLDSVMLQNAQDAQTWWVFCSSRVQSRVTRFAYEYERTATDKHKFGMYVKEYQVPSSARTVTMKVHPMFDFEGFDDLAVLVNMNPDNVKALYHTVWDTAWHKTTVPWAWSGQDEYVRGIHTLRFQAEDINLAILTDVAAAA